MKSSSTLPGIAHTPFAQDVLHGLTKTPKKLPSKYFYDEMGDKLFQDIMRMPEYYLTDCEMEVFQLHKAQLLNTIGDAPFDLIELGAGDGAKTKVLLRYFLEKETRFQYRPVDISGNVLLQLESELKEDLPELTVDALEGDYFDVLSQISGSENRKVILFLGGNIGNFNVREATGFLKQLAEQLDPGDLLLTGFDLKKDPEIILRAYNDPAGVTAAFNLNLLSRINRELEADFDITQFKHWETYNPATGETRSYLISKSDQTVHIPALNLKVHFDAWEAISVELSQKYSLKEVETMAAMTGFTPVLHFFDSKQYFVDTLWRR